MANSQGYSVTQSMWALDADENFKTTDIYTSADVTSVSSGELQNDYSQCFGSSVFDTDYHMKVNMTNIEAYPATVDPLTFGARLYNSKIDTGGPENAQTFAEYAIGSAASGTLSNAYSISAWIYPTFFASLPVPLGLNSEKKFHIVSFQSSDHPTASSGPTAATCSVRLFFTASQTPFTGLQVTGNALYVGTETVLSTSHGYVTDLAYSDTPLYWTDHSESLGWYHVLCCYDATTPDINSEMTDRIKLYINGNLTTLTTQSVNLVGSSGSFYGEIHPSTGAIGNNAGLNLEFETITGSEGVPNPPAANDPYPVDDYFINSVFEGRITEVSFFNYSLHSYDTGLPALMYNNGCPPKMSSMPVFDNIQQRPVGYYRCGATLPGEIENEQIPGPVSGVPSGPGDTAGSSSWDPDSTPGGGEGALNSARLVNAVGYQWGETYTGADISSDRLYSKGDGYPVITAEDAALVVDTSLFYASGSTTSGPCKDGYDAPDKSNLIAAPIYNRKHSLASAFSVTHFGWSVPKVDYPSSEDYQDRTLTMPIPEVSAALGQWADTWPLSSIFGPIATEARTYPLGKIQTCGGNAEWEAGPLAGSVINGAWVSSPEVPFYNSYDDYNQNMRLKNQEYSIIPEFLISDQIDFYFNSQKGDIFAPNYSQFAIKGAETGSSGVPTNSSEDNFYEIFSNSDFMKNFYVIKQDLKDIAAPSTLTLKCKTIVKFLPYDGFFPSERSLQIAHQFSKSYGDFIEYTGLDKSLTKARFRPFLTPFFRPGIVYNTIKSGIAVDFPIYTSSYQVVQYRTSVSESSDYYALGTQDAYSSAGTLGELPAASWDLRVPFEAVVEPEKYLKDVLIYDLEPHPSSAIDIQNKWTGEGDVLYKRMMHNYLAAIPEFFLQNSEFTSLKSKPESEFLTVQSGTSYGMRVKIKSSMNKPRVWQTYTSNGSVLNDYECPQHPRVLTGDAEGLRETFTMYSRPSAFGPPVAGTDYLGFRNDILPTDARNVFYNTDLFPSDSLLGINPSYCPAPMGGEAWYDIIWFCQQSGQVTVDEIFSQATINKWRIDADPVLNIGTGSATGSLYGSSKDQAIWSSNEEELVYSTPMRTSYANAYAMQLDASFNVLGKKDDRWVIESKFETPQLNFNTETSIRPILSSSDTLTIPTNGSESVPRGMWHQFGTIETDKGIYLEVGEIPESWRTTRGYADPNRPSPSGSSGTGSFKVELYSGIDLNSYQNDNFKDLSELVGFEKSKKLGNLSNSLTVSEAVVAVPFRVVNGEKQFFEIPEDVIRKALGDLNSISSDKSVSQAGLAVKAALKGLEENASLLGNLSDQKAAKVRAAAGAASAAASNQLDRDEDDANTVSETIKDMVSKMKKFVFPPSMDFVNNLGKVTPFSMYIFEFSKTFNQTDLAYMWQNVSPPSSGGFSMQEATISHKLLSNELMGTFGNGDNDPIDPNLQWMIFKVKQRANNNYFSKISKETGPRAEQFKVSYNWPYDFFSLVEFANIDTKIGFGKGLKPKGKDEKVAEIREDPSKVAVKGKRGSKKRK